MMCHVSSHRSRCRHGRYALVDRGFFVCAVGCRVLLALSMHWLGTALCGLWVSELVFRCESECVIVPSRLAAHVLTPLLPDPLIFY